MAAGPSLPKTLSPGLPAVLCPYGHWNNGRFYEQGSEAGAQVGSYPTVALGSKLLNMIGNLLAVIKGLSCTAK